MIKLFTELPNSQQKKVQARFIMPSDTSEVRVNVSTLLAYEIIGGAKFSLTLKKQAVYGAFHNRALRNNS